MTLRAAKLTLSILWKVETAIVSILVAAICGLLIADIGLRVFTQSWLHGAQRTSVYLMLFTGFLGIGLASARGRHLRPRFADQLLPASLTARAQQCGDVFMALVWLGFSWLGFTFVREAYAFQDVARVITVPLWTIYLIVPYAFASVALRHALFACYPALRPQELVVE